MPVEKVEVARIHKLASRCLAVAARKRIQCVKSKVHRWRDIETCPDILASNLISYILSAFLGTNDQHSDVSSKTNVHKFVLHKLHTV